MARQNLENEELGGIIRAKINDNFSELYGNAGLVASVQPTISSDFTRNDHKLYEQYGLEPKSITQMYDVVRASTATYVDATGKIRTAGVNEPRIDFSSGQGRLLVEEARTNLLTWSEDFSNSVWSKIGFAEIINTSTASPIVGKNWQRLQVNATGTGNAVMRQVAAISPTMTIGYLVKPDQITNVMVRVNAGIDVRVNFDIVNRVVVDSFNFTGQVHIIPFSDGSLFVGFTQSGFTSGNFNTELWLKPIANTSIGTHTFENVGDGIYVDYAQLEQGSTPSSYIPTEASAVTRAADNVSRVLGDEFNSSSFTVLIRDFETVGAADTIQRLISIDNGTNDERLALARTRLITSIGGTPSTPAISDIPNKANIVIRFNGAHISLFVNGALTFTQTRLLNSHLFTTLRIGRDPSQFIRYQLTGKLKVYPLALSDQECIQLTKV